MRHASNCNVATVAKPCSYDWCASYKALWFHMGSCVVPGNSDPKCGTLMCSDSKKLLGHFKSCKRTKSSSCSVCPPLHTFIAEDKVEQQKKQKVSHPHPQP